MVMNILIEKSKCTETLYQDHDLAEKAIVEDVKGHSA